MTRLTPDQIRGLKDLVLDGFVGAVGWVEMTHAALARQPFAVLEVIPGVAAPARAVATVEGAIRGGVYASLRASHAVARVTLDAAFDRLGERERG